ncbi:hypothetical protein SDC9_201484 [bioreactor metagenome]|uniref:EamA domain-containing protein n=1 Tax=bioreactor metagenome TaxID=1076179 RepID=A0A645IR31_9ZZZZ
MMPLAQPWQMIRHVSNIKLLFLMISLGLLPSALSYICYMGGISRGVELSRAGVISSVELVVSVAIAWLLMGESFSLIKFSGILLMLLSILIASRNAEALGEASGEAINKSSTGIDQT